MLWGSFAVKLTISAYAWKSSLHLFEPHREREGWNCNNDEERSLIENTKDCLFCFTIIFYMILLCTWDKEGRQEGDIVQRITEKIPLCFKTLLFSINFMNLNGNFFIFFYFTLVMLLFQLTMEIICHNSSLYEF